jgi:hypothetical protein
MKSHAHHFGMAFHFDTDPAFQFTTPLEEKISKFHFAMFRQRRIFVQMKMTKQGTTA